MLISLPNISLAGTGAVDFYYSLDNPSRDYNSLYYSVYNNNWWGSSTGTIWLKYEWYDALNSDYGHENKDYSSKTICLGTFTLMHGESRGPYKAFSFRNYEATHGSWEIWTIAPNGVKYPNGNDSW
jgi:hypothetical protein